MAALLGELPRNSTELADALADPDVLNYDRGDVYFIVNDIDKGLEAWRNMEPAHIQYLWTGLAATEVFFAPGVTEDPRYQVLLDELGNVCFSR